MCKIYNQVGSLTTIEAHLRNHRVKDMNSLHALIDFQKGYPVAQKQIISHHTAFIDQEKATLKEEVTKLDISIEARKSELQQRFQLELDRIKRRFESLPSKHATIVQSAVGYLTKNWMRYRIRYHRHYVDVRIWLTLLKSTYSLHRKNKRYQYLGVHFRDVVSKSSASELRKLERKKKVIDEINTCIYGALGEQMVVTELEKCSDDYILVNDFTCSFRKPIYNPQERRYIKSVQIDHVLITPAGIFLIETKYWSEHSLNNLSLRSPVAQIKRASHALFKILSEATDNARLVLNTHHWGKRKIPIKSLIVFIDQKPREEFEYVKILTLDKLRSYIAYFEAAFSNQETQAIANYLLGFNASSNKTAKKQRKPFVAYSLKDKA